MRKNRIKIVCIKLVHLPLLIEKFIFAAVIRSQGCPAHSLVVLLPTLFRITPQENE
jgi:hypothetical protein